MKKANKPKKVIFTLPIFTTLRNEDGTLSQNFIENFQQNNYFLSPVVSVRDVGKKLDFEIWDNIQGKGYLIEFKNKIITVFIYSNGKEGGGGMARSSPLRRTTKSQKRFLRNVERQIKPLQLGKKKTREVKIEALEKYEDITDIAINTYLPGVVMNAARETLSPEMCRMIEHKIKKGGSSTPLLPYDANGKPC